MSRGGTYLGLLAALRQRSTNVIRRRRGRTVSRLLKALRTPKR
jgi:hypothetical protein